MILIFLLGALFAILMLFNNINNDLIIKIKSKHTISHSEDKYYIAKRKSDKKGYFINDWLYYKNTGELIKNRELKKLLYNSFKNEDWYGDYQFYVDDESEYIKTISLDKIKKEVKVVNSVKEMEESVYGTPI